MSGEMGNWHGDSSLQRINSEYLDQLLIKTDFPHHSHWIKKINSEPYTS